ncbi:MAG: hypothetical protein KDC46_13895 [Thermoleophilia bacterium]|nr:hypothetical protein [Thermoleophilia bacterium]
MPTSDALPPGIVRRAAAIARGPHACPTCESPTWAEPPVPWTDLRDYVVQCDTCERPVAVRIDRDRILRRGAVPEHLRDAAGQDAVAELLDTRGRRAFALRLAAAAAPSLLVAAFGWYAGAAPATIFLLAVALVVPGAAWFPSLLAAAIDACVSRVRDSTSAALEAVRLGRRPKRATTIELVPGRWDQWQREQRLRERDRSEHPEEVLVELERVLDERELRRVRLLAERGEVPAGNLADLAQFRRTWVDCSDDELPQFLRSS